MLSYKIRRISLGNYEKVYGTGDLFELTLILSHSFMLFNEIAFNSFDKFVLRKNYIDDIFVKTPLKKIRRKKHQRVFRDYLIVLSIVC